MLEWLRRGLTEEGHNVVTAAEGSAGWNLAQSFEFDAILLDVMLPKMSGFELANKLRTERASIPVLMLTARDSVPDIVRGLQAGVADYLIKPFGFNELLARLRAFQLFSTPGAQKRLQVGDLTLYPDSHEVSRAGAVIKLTRTEYNLLEGLMNRAGVVISRRKLIEAVWGFDHDIEDNTLDAFIRLLRKKVQIYERLT